MRKTDKKREKAITAALTDVCTIALAEVQGFRWLTHRVNYTSFPDSLHVVCVFDKRSNLTAAISHHQDQFLRSLISEKLSAAGIQFNNSRRKVSFDTEEACREESGADWTVRLR